MFYDSEINIIKTVSGHVNEDGDWVEGKDEIVETLKCDIQPYTNELAYKEFGYEGDVSYIIYCPRHEELKLHGKTQLPDNKIYRNEVCLHWDDYTILVVSDRHDS